MAPRSKVPSAAPNWLSGIDEIVGMPPSQCTKVAIIGAGRGGTALLDLLHQLRTVHVIGIIDTNQTAPGLQLARELHVPVFSNMADLLNMHGLHLVMDVTADPTMGETLRQQIPDGTDLLSGPASRLLCDLVEHESILRSELLQTDKLAEIGSFAAGIAHDMNNPLQLILGLAENLMEEHDVETVHLHARDIIEAVKRTTAICRDLTSYSRRTSADPNSAVLINTKLDEALKIARYAVGLQDIEVRKAYWPDLTVTGSPDELLHVFINLITNAVQAMDGGGILTVTTAAIDRSAIVRISDTGSGISPEIRTRIFEPFFTTKPPGKGTGLGLYNIKNVVLRMHGAIDVESQPEQGTTFTIPFPMKAEADNRTGPP